MSDTHTDDQDLSPPLMQGVFDWQKVAPMYQEEHRVYHGMSHIHFILRQVPLVTESRDQGDWLTAVAWLHDAYHDPLAVPPHNEQMSANLLDGEMGAAFTARGLDLAREAILASAHHTRDQDNLHPLVAVFLDLDISGLASDEREFNRQTRAVAEEFRRAGKSTEKIIESHAHFCQKMLARKRLYYTCVGRGERETLARDNLQRVVLEPLYFV